MTATIAVDFDGVIHRYSAGWQDGEIYDPPVSGALAALRHLMDRFAVYVHTTRDPQPVAEWLALYGVPVVTEFELGPAPPDGVFWNDQSTVLVTNRKLAAVAYIDDRAIRFENWDQALAELDARLP